MIDILKKIEAYKKEEVAARKRKVGLPELQSKEFFNRKTISAKERIQQNPYGIIAEFKRRSPSKPNIHLDAKVEEVVPDYVQNGAATVSILTDEHFFGGSPDFIAKVRSEDIPILQKDFMVDEHQIYEAKANGADVILLIAAILEKSKIQEFAALAKSLGLEVLLEFHAGEEFEKLDKNVDLVGINNRNLKTFAVDIQHSVKMRNQLPKERLVIAESGIHSVEDYLMLKNNGFQGFLMGEYFMKHQNPGNALKKFIQKI